MLCIQPQKPLLSLLGWGSIALTIDTQSCPHTGVQVQDGAPQRAGVAFKSVLCRPEVLDSPIAATLFGGLGFKDAPDLW